MSQSSALECCSASSFNKCAISIRLSAGVPVRVTLKNKGEREMSVEEDQSVVFTLRFSIFVLAFRRARQLPRLNCFVSFLAFCFAFSSRCPWRRRSGQQRRCRIIIARNERLCILLTASKCLFLSQKLHKGSQKSEKSVKTEPLDGRGREQ